MANQNMANREVCDLIFVDYATKKPFLNLDFGNVTTTELTGESMFAYGGKGHPKRIQFTGERGGTIAIETQIQTAKLWELITGGDISNTAKFIAREELSATGGKVTLGATPVTGTVVAYAKEDDCGTELTTTVAGAEVTITGDATEVVVYYMKELTSGVKRINIKSTSFPKNFIVYGDTVMKTEDDEVLPYKLIAYKCAPQSNLTLTYSNTGDPGTITITCDLMADKDDNILDLVLIEDEA